MAIPRKLLRITRWIVIVITVLLVLFILFHPPLVKWAVRKYSPEYTGRQITLEHFRLNPFSGTVSIDGLEVMEAQGDPAFLSVGNIFVNVTLFKLIGGSYEITELRITHPVVRIVQKGERFNFSDLIDRFTSDTTDAEDPSAEPVEYALYDLRVNDLELDYTSDLMHEPLQIANASVECPQLKWDVNMIEAVAKMTTGNNAELTAEVSFDLERLLYTAHVNARGIQCAMMKPYIMPYMRIGELSGTLRSDLFMQGDGNDPMAFTMSGSIGTDDVVLTDPEGVKLAGLKRMDLVIDTLDVKNEIYRIRRFVLTEPYAFSELYDDGDNWSKLLVMTDTTTTDTTATEGVDAGYDPENPFSMLAHYVKLVAEDYRHMDYLMDSIGVYNGTVVFNDFTLEQPFHYQFTQLQLQADDINSGAKELVITAAAILNESGRFEGELGLDPNTRRNMRFAYALEGVGMPAFAPYTLHYVAHPILSGRTKYVCTTTIVDNKLKSENHVLVEDFNFGRKESILGAYDVPVMLATSLMKDRHGNIDLRIPVEGDLDDPEYKVWPVIWQVLRNLIVKAVTAPATALARTFDADEDDLRAVRFLYLQEGLRSQQEKPLNILARVVKERPGLHIELVQSGDRTGEAEAYAINSAKAMFFADSTGAPVDPAKEETLLAGVNIKSPGFTGWINGKVAAGDQPVQRKCMQLVGQQRADAEVVRLWAARKEALQAYLTLDKELPAGALTIRDRVETDTIPALGQPAFIAVYSTAGEP